MPKFSFFLPAFKAKYLDSAIKSIISQSYHDWELLIVNDCSPENVQSIVEHYTTDTRVKYFENSTNRGGEDLVGFWNSYIPICSGEYIIFASDDDSYEPDYLFEMLHLSRKYPECDLFHCRTRYIDGQEQIVQITQPAQEYEKQADFVYQKLIWGRKLTLQEYCFKKRVLQECGGIVNFPLAWYSDNATTYQMARNGVAYSNKCLFNFRLSEANISGQDKKCVLKIESMKQYVKWMDSFLPKMTCESTDDKFMRDRMLKLYKGIIYSHYHIYLSNLNASEFFHEIRYIHKHHIFPFKTSLSMVLRHFHLRHSI